ncbi:MAG: hypothetical protein GXP31_12540 [Kiritimatiellaeota bacterium]|nr:hypothetical protein [Kiritimatiellota bacterium]
MLLVADAHVSVENGNVDSFFAMLDRIADTDEGVVFLGDILELWIGLPRYETDLHRRFLAWCRKQCDRRTVGFVEGNHEFFVARHHADAFSWCAAREYRDGECLYAHGDLIDAADRGYRLFRALTKNGAAHWLLAHAPGIPALVGRIKSGMERRSRRCAKHVPERDAARFAEACFAQGIRLVATGHFHRFHQYVSGNGVNRLIVTPAWGESECVVRVRTDGKVEVVHGREI